MGRKIGDLLSAHKALMRLQDKQGIGVGVDLANELERYAHDIWRESGGIPCATWELSAEADNLIFQEAQLA